MRFSSFHHLIRRRLSQFFSGSALDRAGLVWAEEELYPRLLREDMKQLAAQGVIAIEFLPREKPSFTIGGLSAADRICIYSADGARRMTKAALKRSLSSHFPAKEVSPSAISLQVNGIESMEAKVFFDWLHSHGVIFSQRNDGSWGLARRARRGMGLLPHPDCPMWGVIYTQDVFSSLTENVANALAGRAPIAREAPGTTPSFTAVRTSAFAEQRIIPPENLLAAIDDVFPPERRARAMSHFEGLAIEAAVRRGARKAKTATVLSGAPSQAETESREPVFSAPKRRTARL